MYNTHYKIMHEGTKETGILKFKVTNGDLVRETLTPFEERPPGTGKYQFGKISRDFFEELPNPLIPIDSLPPPIS